MMGAFDIAYPTHSLPYHPPYRNPVIRGQVLQPGHSYTP